MENKNELIQTEDRKSTNCMKWDGLMQEYGESDLLPMWVADMDFKAPQSVQNALQQAIDHGIYGYCIVPDSFHQAFIDWEQRRHSYTVQKEWLRFLPGVVPGLYWMVNILTQPGDACIILTPSYYPFMNSIRDNDRKLICCELVNDCGRYSIDYEKFERDIVENDVKLFFFCSPHNPSGRVWKVEEIQTVMEICRKHHVFVVSDEIHHDIIIGDRPHTPTATTGNYHDFLITLTAASKTFNLAAWQNSFAIIEGEELRQKFDQFVKHICFAKGNKLGYIAVEAAYRGGEPWLASVLNIIRENYAYAKSTLEQALPNVVVTPLEGTYLMWVDLGAYVPHDQLQEFVQKTCRLAVDYGDWFRAEEGDAQQDTHIRLNLATTHENVAEAVRRIIANLT